MESLRTITIPPLPASKTNQPAPACWETATGHRNVGTAYGIGGRGHLAGLATPWNDETPGRIMLRPGDSG